MFKFLQQKLTGVWRELAGTSRLTEDNISEAVRQIRLALLEADVNFSVVKQLIQAVKQRSLGSDVCQSVSPSQQFIKIVHDELVKLLGANPEAMTAEQFKASLKPSLEVLNWGSKPTIWVFCGLQGSGKTTHVAKIANYFKKHFPEKKLLLAACDLQRPMAIEQLRQLGSSIHVDVFTLDGEKDPLLVAKLAREKAIREGYDALLVDTAGRLHVDELLMNEIESLCKLLDPQEKLFVANAAMGQDVVRTALAFHEKVKLTGAILTMLDSDARGGAVLSIRAVADCPIKFEGIGERVDDLQPFNPYSMADRLLGMGDTVNLVRRAQEIIDEKESESLKQKLLSATFTYDDYLKQLQAFKKMGSIASLVKMLPGMQDIQISETEMRRSEAIVLSMTVSERQEKVELTVSRRKRIAKGSGVTIDEVNRLVKGFREAKEFFKNMPNQLKQLQKVMGGKRWR